MLLRPAQDLCNHSLARPERRTKAIRLPTVGCKAFSDLFWGDDILGLSYDGESDYHVKE